MHTNIYDMIEPDRAANRARIMLHTCAPGAARLECLPSHASNANRALLLYTRAQQGRPHGGALRARFVGEQRRLYAQQSRLIAGTLGAPDSRHSRRA